MAISSYRPWRPVSVVAAPSSEPGVLTKAEALAIKRLNEGDATPEQQKAALYAILYKIAQVDDQSFRSDDHGGVRDTAFAEGKRFVGLQVKKLLAVPLDILTGERAERIGHPQSRGPK